MANKITNQKYRVQRLIILNTTNYKIFILNNNQRKHS
ncbi:Uncharacterised protein [Klebsiella pneumoniae]|nr:Uncharacterised protein [Klebsiella pneumoniae]SLP19636.1 Uncharacterised protein [Klebsiella pneumoniae]SLP34385.1 Uncharacterised protein [Klebsiella pneumoniae]